MLIDRRRILSGLGSCGVTASFLNGVAPVAANAQSASDYRALVCLFFRGGLDHNDTIIHMDDASHARLAAARPNLFAQHEANGHSRSQSNLLELKPENPEVLNGRRYGMPQELKELHQMFNDGDCAIVGRVGSLAEDGTNRQSYHSRSVELPPRLFSHNDQQNYWQGLGVEGATHGWGGLFMDKLSAKYPRNDPRYSAIITSSSSLLLNGRKTVPFRIGIEGPPKLQFSDVKSILGSSKNNDDTRALFRDFFQRRATNASNLFQRDYNLLQVKAYNDSLAARNAYSAGSRVTTEFGISDLEQQLHAVSNAISVRNGLNVSRQIFYVSIGRFDTHSNQAVDLPYLHKKIGKSITAFKAAMVELGVWNNVTVFTAADFGRTFVENGQGTDHGWGGHHFVAGGSVRGKRIFGDLPSADTSGQEYTDARGRLIPSTSIEQYSASFGEWLGMSDQDLNSALPNLSRFSKGPLNLFV